MAFFGLKTYFKIIFLGCFCPPIKVMRKNQAKKASKWVYLRGALKALPLSMSIPVAPYGRVKLVIFSDSDYFSQDQPILKTYDGKQKDLVLRLPKGVTVRFFLLLSIKIFSQTWLYFNEDSFDSFSDNNECNIF